MFYYLLYFMMGGKNYFCDYCYCYMKNDRNVRKLHNVGLTHNIAKVTYLRRYEDPRKLLAEESAKIPCTRYVKGYCKFDLFCQYSHFNETQLQELRKIVYKLEQQEQRQQQQMLSKSNVRQDWQTQIPWFQQDDRRRRERIKLLRRLPPSLKPINFNKLNHIALNTQWG